VEAIPLTPDDDDRGAAESSARPVTSADISMAGVQLPLGAAAKLALMLHRSGNFALSVHIGRAVDDARSVVALEREDGEAILRAIADDPSSRFRELRDALGDFAGDDSEKVSSPRAPRTAEAPPDASARGVGRDPRRPEGRPTARTIPPWPTSG
jgi:hypothetical protein